MVPNCLMRGCQVAQLFLSLCFFCDFAGYCSIYVLPKIKNSIDAFQVKFKSIFDQKSVSFTGMGHHRNQELIIF